MKFKGRISKIKKHTLTKKVGFAAIAIILVVSVMVFFWTQRENGREVKVNTEECRVITGAANEDIDKTDYNKVAERLQGNYEKCVTPVSQAKTLEASDKSHMQMYRANLAQAYYVNGDKERAKQIAAEVIEIDKSIDRQQGPVDTQALASLFKAQMIVNEEFGTPAE